ncbi:MAG: non-canonical purine NTP diphosphatase [Bacteroidales bacterium]|nr:non-canonical purine NTP diphosphatase [Bacteroidales bacterium]
MKLIFATNNINKINEISKILGDDFKILNLKDIGCFEQLPENSDTLEDNAKEKALFIYNKYKTNCFADDTGLEIDVLNGEPGVFSARYAGEENCSEKNKQKVLKNMKDKNNRKARFRTVISLIINGIEYQFTGIINGTILEKPQGKAGFGYDPIFMPDAYSKSFAEMTITEKNKISHRGIAVRKLTEFLKKI